MTIPLSSATVVIDSRLGSGIGRIVKNVVPRIANQVKRLILLGREDPREAWNIGAANVEYVKYDARAYSLAEQYRFPLARAIRADLLHVPHYNVPLLWPKPLVVTVNDLTQFTPEFGAGRIKRAFARSFIAWALWRANQILTISHYVRGDFIRQYGARAARLSVCHPGVDPKIFRPIEKRRALEQVGNELGIKFPFVLCVGSVRPNKNVAGLIAAFSIARRQPGFEHHLVIAGEREGFMTAARLAIPPEVRECVVFTGYVPDRMLPVLYAAADVFVLPSLSEGFGIPLLEAMACGTPTVASNRTALPEVAGDAALMVDPCDTEQLASAIVRAARDEKLRTCLIDAGKRRAARFDWDQTAERHLEAYSRALNS